MEPLINKYLKLRVELELQARKVRRRRLQPRRENCNRAHLQCHWEASPSLDIRFQVMRAGCSKELETYSVRKRG